MFKRHLPNLALTLTLPLCTTLAYANPNSTTVLTSPVDVNATTERLAQRFSDQGMTIFAIIDHQAAAKQAGLTMQPAKVIIYGAPKAGTPLMLKDPHFALKLPLKVLVTENQHGRIEVVFERTAQVIQGNQITAADVENTLAKAEKLIAATLQQH